MNKEMNLHKNDKLKIYLGKIKYQKEKAIFIIELIDKYIYRIEENICKEKNIETYEAEEYKNKDLLIEVEELLKELEEGVKE